jgi:hypothetical protein
MSRLSIWGSKGFKCTICVALFVERMTVHCGKPT